MQPEIHKLLLDIQFALLEIQEFTAGMNLSSYQVDSKSKAAVERKFEIIGEACSRFRSDFPEEFEKIRNGHQIIGFRNRLIHGYDSVDDAIVWDVLQTKWRAEPLINVNQFIPDPSNSISAKSFLEPRMTD